MQTEPKYREQMDSLVHAVIKFKAEEWDGKTLDTEVIINGALLCFITWPDREAFLKDLKEVVDKYII